MRRLLFSAVLLLSLTPTARAVTVERVVSPGGIEAWLVQDHLNPIIDMEISFLGGAATDPANRQGVSVMAAALLDEGAGPLKSQAFQGQLEDLAVELSFDSGLDRLRCHLKTLTVNRDKAFDLFHLALTSPRFDQEAVERIRAETLVELNHDKQDPETIAAREWFKLMFPNHPYGRPTSGNETSVKAITKADLQGYVLRTVVRDTLTVGVAGDITPEELGRVLDRVFGALPTRHRTDDVADVVPSKSVGTVVISRNIPQSVAIFGEQGLKRDDPDWFPALVMNYILGGGGFSSWLTEEVREKRGLAYSVYSQLEPFRHAGLLVGAVATRNEKLGQSLEIIKAQWARMRDQGPSAEELDDAKTYLVGSFPLQLDSTAQVASLMVQLQLDHLGADYLDHRSDLIKGVTLDDVMRAAKRLLDPESLGIVVVGKPDGLTKTP